jgi:acyl-CoA synthetase (AMP-forming)/AMP-acid ligase II
MTRHRIATVLLLSSAAAFASPDHRPPPDDKAKPELLKLRAELFHLTGDAAKQQLDHFRPLCDADGYPLVGNIATKGERTQPSEVCAAVREHKK